MRAQAVTSRIRQWLTPLAFLAAILVLWECVVWALSVPPYLLPAPTAILRVLLGQGRSLAAHAAMTMLESVLGFVAANVAGFSLAIAFAHSKTLERGIYPYAIALKTTPIIAMAPLLVVWLGTGIASKVMASALICFFPILVNSAKGLRAVDEEALDLFESLNASSLHVFLKLRLPTSLPYVFSALKISTSLSIVGAVVGEFVGATQGLGYVILVSSYHMETDMMFAATVVAAFGGVAFFGVVSLVERQLVFWEEPAVE